MTSTSSSYRVRRTYTETGGGIPDLDLDDTKTRSFRTYQVYRGMSPNTSNRLEVSAPI